VKQSRYTPWKRFEGEEYSSYSFSTSALNGGEWSASRLGRDLTQGKGPPVPIVGWVGSRAGLGTEATGKIIRLCRGSNLDCPVVQSVARHYTDWATPAPRKSCTFYNTESSCRRFPSVLCAWWFMENHHPVLLWVRCIKCLVLTC
jgi:hypothetical protein